MNAQSTQLALNDTCRQLAATQSFDEIKTIRDKAEAIRVYAKSAQLGLQAQNQAAELKLRAERRAGELLAGLKLRGGDRKSKGRCDPLKLCDLGITKTQSKRWQKEATLPEEEFESLVEQANRLGVEISSASLMRRACQWRGDGHSNQHDTNEPSGKRQSPNKTPPEHSGKAPQSPSSDILETIAELKGHQIAMANLLARARSEPPREPDTDRLLHRYLSETGELIARLEKLLMS